MKSHTPRRPPLKLPFEYGTTRDFRIVSLEKDGVLCIPVFGLSDYHGAREQALKHTHPECLEISYCLRGELAFACDGEEFPFRPGSVFVTKPKEPHCLLTPDKGLRMYWMFFRVPKRGFPLTDAQELGAYAQASGMDAVSVVPANFFRPGSVDTLIDYRNAAVRKGDIAKATAGMKKVCDIVDILVQYGGVAGGKAMMAVHGLDMGDVRLPCKSLTAAEKADCVRRLQKVGYR